MTSFKQYTYALMRPPPPSFVRTKWMTPKVGLLEKSERPVSFSQQKLARREERIINKCVLRVVGGWGMQFTMLLHTGGCRGEGGFFIDLRTY